MINQTSKPVRDTWAKEKKQQKNKKEEKQRILKQRNKTNSNEKTSLKYSDTSFMIIHCITHCIGYIFSCLKQERRIRRFVHPIKASERPSGRKKVIFKQDRSFQKIPTELDLKPFAWHQSCKSNQIDKRDKIKSTTRLAVKGKSR